MLERSTSKKTAMKLLQTVVVTVAVLLPKGNMIKHLLVNANTIVPVFEALCKVS